MALQYSTPRISLGRESSSGDTPIRSKAFCRAAGKEIPRSSSSRSRDENAGWHSARAVSIRFSPWAVSVPKHRVSHSRSRIRTPPAANPSAEDRLTVTGSSTTRSAPQATAASARRLLSRMAGAPR